MRVSYDVAQKENKWSGRNSARWQSKAYDELYKSATLELDPVKRAQPFSMMTMWNLAS